MNYAITLFGYPILLRGEWTPDLKAHEGRHAERQREIGYIRWLTRYLWDIDFRIAEERDAYRVSMAYGQSAAVCAKAWVGGPVRRWWFGIEEEEAKKILLQE